jgi:four helix bundle protein
MAPTQGHRGLVAWQKAMALAEAVYPAVWSFPDWERYGLVSRVARAAVSVPANIAGEHGRAGSREFANVLSIAPGSFAERETVVELAQHLGCVPATTAATILGRADEVGRMLTVLRNRLRE